MRGNSRVINEWIKIGSKMRTYNLCDIWIMRIRSSAGSFWLKKQASIAIDVYEEACQNSEIMPKRQSGNLDCNNGGR